MCLVYLCIDSWSATMYRKISLDTFDDALLNEGSCESGLILGLCPANERWRYIVTTPLIGWVQD